MRGLFDDHLRQQEVAEHVERLAEAERDLVESAGKVTALVHYCETDLGTKIDRGNLSKALRGLDGRRIPDEAKAACADMGAPYSTRAAAVRAYARLLGVQITVERPRGPEAAQARQLISLIRQQQRTMDTLAAALEGEVEPAAAIAIIRGGEEIEHDDDGRPRWGGRRRPKR